MCKFLPPHLHPLAYLHPPYLFKYSCSFVSCSDCSLLFHVKAPRLFELKLMWMSCFIVVLEVELSAAFGRYNQKKKNHV